MDYSHLKDDYESIALLFQGGGALGSYQAGVYQGIYENRIPINIVGGVSIGAINAAIIAGNPEEIRLEKLRSFWNTIIERNYSGKDSNPFRLSFQGINALKTNPLFHFWFPYLYDGSIFLQNLRTMEGMTDVFMSVLEGQKGFYFPKYTIPFGGKPDRLSYYNIDELYENLDDHIDMDLLNDPSHLRICVAASNVETGHFERFSNWEMDLGLEHIVASAAFPPAFPAVKIGDSYYWDGALVSNTPLTILNDNPEKSHLIFQVDLWSSRGELPENMVDVNERVEELTHASKTKLITEIMSSDMDYSNLIEDLLELVPDNDKTDAIVKRCEEAIKNRVVNIIELVYKKERFAHVFREYDFGEWYINEHWRNGFEDISATCRHPEWFEVPTRDRPFVNHDIHVYNWNMAHGQTEETRRNSSRKFTDVVKHTGVKRKRGAKK